jgi:hypothetical protein
VSLGGAKQFFIVGRDEQIAKDIGYLSFLTARRGPMYQGDTTYLIKRDHTLAKWDNYQLRYFLSLQTSKGAVE